MSTSELDQAIRLLRAAETEPVPTRKYAMLNDGLDLLDEVTADPTAPERAREIARNLRSTSARALLRQLVALRNVDFRLWLQYTMFLFTRLNTEIKAALGEDAALSEQFQRFLRLWAPEAIAVLERAIEADGASSAKRS